MFDLGLARVGRLLANRPLPWRAIHVAGTNGKGSVCAYISALLHAGNISCGRFNSPHLIDRWDCISINEKTVNETLFHQVEAEVIARDQKEDIKASEFELLTATAFEIFARTKVEIAVVEVGLGGRLDATNVIQDPLVTVITKIGLDHEQYLGDTLEKIALQKAGIIKPQVPCVVDSTNSQSVLDVIEQYSSEANGGPIVGTPRDSIEVTDQIWNLLSTDQFEFHQQVNVSLAFEAVRQSLQQTHPDTELSCLLPAIAETAWAGRLQRLSVQPLTGREQDILLDGAHNVQSAEILASYVYRKIRKSAESVTWVLAASQGKDLKTILSVLLRPSDNLATVEFGAVDGMPWVKPSSAQDIMDSARRATDLGKTYVAHADVNGALRWAAEVSGGGSLVVAGSLYLVSDVLRSLRNAETN
ncbi:folylpolyglutamate synthase [Loxospora ochrophaea]|nr:folylpolyglutamate synthase [Loxospora ochrophaea]